jgi:hypothetical protein
MPLPIDVETLPLYLWERWSQTTIGPAELEHVLPWARAGMLLFWWTLLLYGRAVGRVLAGPWGGRLAVALLACQPSLLAHAGLATTDIALTATLLAFLYHFRRGRCRGWWLRVALPGLWFGVALLCKASALVFGPLCLVALEVERLARLGAFTLPAEQRPAGLWHTMVVRLRQAWTQLRPARADGMQLFFLGLALTFVYCGCDWETLPSFVAGAKKLPEGPLRDGVVWLAEHLPIFHNAGEAIVRQIGHNVRGHGSFILGEAHPRCFWFYFPVALTMKVTVPLLLLPCVVALLRPRALANWACVAAGVLLIYSVQCRVQIGIRLVLPVVALAAIGGAAALVETARTLRSALTRRMLAGGIAGCLAWSIAACATVWPHGLCYINELWGGTRNGYLRLSDSNYDWGQGLGELARWQERHDVTNLDVWYFGTDPAIARLPVRRVYCPQLGTPQNLAASLEGRRLAVSTTLLYGGYHLPSPIIDWLRARQPVDRTQTFLIYDFTDQASPVAERPDERVVTPPPEHTVSRTSPPRQGS